MPKKYDVVAITGTYQKDGQDKNRYSNVGMVIEKNGKFYLKMTHPVTVHDDGNVINFFSLYESRSQGSQGNRNHAQEQRSAPLNDDFVDESIPF